MIKLNEKIGEDKFENLFNQNYPPADVFTVALKTGQGTLERGSVLALSSTGEMVILGTAAAEGETLAANCVLAERVDTGESDSGSVTGIAYRTGHFNGNKLITKDGHVITAAEKEALRAGGILLSDAAEI